MFDMIFIELKKALRTKSVYISLAAGFLIILLSYFAEGRVDIINNQINFEEYLNLMQNDGNREFFLTNRGYYYSIYIILLPLISALAYGDSYINEISQGIIKNIYIRCNRKDYLVAKFFCNYLITFIVIVVPLIIDGIIMRLFLPSYSYNGIFTDMSILYDKGWMIELFKYNSNYFVIVSIGLTGLVASSFSSITFAISNYIKNKYIVIFVPFICYYAINTISIIQIRSTEFLPLGSDYLYNSYSAIIFIILVSILSFFIFKKSGERLEGF